MVRGLPRTRSEKISETGPMEVFLQALVRGILLGGFYSLMGMGQNMIFGVMNIVNFCHGEMLMVGINVKRIYILTYTYASVAIAQVQGQEWKTVWPFEFASSKIQEVTLG